DGVCTGMNVAREGDRQTPRRESARRDRPAFVREAVFATGWIRLDTAVASSRGTSHAVNEDWHSALGGTSPLFVVADGVSSGAMHGGPAQLLTLDDTYRHLSEQPPPGGSLDDPARMVGNGAVDAPNVRDVDLGCGEMLLLCSDGIHKHAGPRDIARLLRGPTP